jgi:hypothetical protein
MKEIKITCIWVDFKKCLLFAGIAIKEKQSIFLAV